MKNHVYYDVYHRQRKIPGFFFLRWFGGKRGIFLLSFFITLLIGKLVLWDGICQYSSWNMESIKQMKLEQIDTKGLFSYLLLQRGELLAFLLLSGFTKWKKVIYYLCSGAAGCILGVFALSFFHAFGWKGIVLLLISLLPQWVIYGILFVYLYWIFVNQDSNRKYTKGWIFLYALSVLGLLLCGIYLECFVNPLLLGFFKSILNL